MFNRSYYAITTARQPRLRYSRVLAGGLLSMTLAGCTSLGTPAANPALPANASPVGAEPAAAISSPAPPTDTPPAQQAATPPEAPPATHAAIPQSAPTKGPDATPGSTTQSAPRPAAAAPRANTAKTAAPATAGTSASTPPAAHTTPPARESVVPAEKPPSLDLASLEGRLRDTHAIGVFTKLSLKNQVDDLLEQFRAYHRGQNKSSLAQLRQQYDLLLLKVLTLLQDSDQQLAASISSSRETIWGILTDPQKFAKI